MIDTSVWHRQGIAYINKTSETISDSAECYAGLSVRFESSAACM